MLEDVTQRYDISHVLRAKQTEVHMGIFYFYLHWPDDYYGCIPLVSTVFNDVSVYLCVNYLMLVGPSSGCVRK